MTRCGFTLAVFRICCLLCLTSAFAEASVGVMDMDLKGYDIYEHDTSWMSAGVCYTHLEADILRQILLRDVSSN